VSKAFEDRPARAKISRGDRASSGLNTLASATDRHLDQSLEGEASRPGVIGATRWQGIEGNGMKARHVDEAGRLGGGENPCGENLGRGCGMKQARKGVRRSNPSRVWETLWAEH
jgi:hypothetical protein